MELPELASAASDHFHASHKVLGWVPEASGCRGIMSGLGAGPAVMPGALFPKAVKLQTAHTDTIQWDTVGVCG